MARKGDGDGGCAVVFLVFICFVLVLGRLGQLEAKVAALEAAAGVKP